MDPLTLIGIVNAIVAATSLFKKGPKEPRMPEFTAPPAGITAAEEAELFAGVERGIGRSAAKAKGRAGTSAAARGFYRSGQLPRLETEIDKTAIETMAGARSQFALDKANRMAGIATARSQFDLSRYGTQAGIYSGQANRFGQTQQAGGEAFGMSIQNLLDIFSRYGGGAKPVSSGSGLGFNPNYTGSGWGR